MKTQKNTSKDKIKQIQYQCIKPKEFRYNENKKRSSIRKIVNMKSQDIPIKIIVQKISTISKTNENQNIIDSNQEDSSNFQNYQLRRKSLSYKRFLTPRDMLFKPKLSVFNRFSYENYQNYTYKNPYKPAKFQPDQRIIRVPQNNPKRGTSKNIQIVFCQKKFQDFVDKANEQITTFYSQNHNYGQNLSPKAKQQLNSKRLTKQYGFTQSLIRSSSLPSDKKMSQTYSGFGHSINLNKHTPRTTLSKCMQEFNTLQKLSTYLQMQQKHNQKYLLHRANDDGSRTVLLQIMSHRFNFLTHLKKKIKNLIFKSLLGCDQIYPYSKLNIHQYIRFLQLFVYRDASTHQLTFFIFNFLFKESEQVSFSAAKNILDLLQGSNKKHQMVENNINFIIDKFNGNQQKIFNQFSKNQLLLYSIIDLIIGK